MPQHLPRLERQWAIVNGLPMHARVALAQAPADAPDVVLVHGVGVSSRYMVPLAQRLAPYCRVYAPDLPGFGRSAPPPRALDIDGLADALRAWMDAAGLQQAALLGNSVGCQTVASLAMRAPERVTHVVLAGPTMDPQARTLRQQAWRWLLNTPWEPPAQALVVAQDYRDCGVRRFARTLKYALDDRIEERLPHLTMPALVVRGTRDTIVPQRWAAEAARLLPQGQLVVIPGAAHTVNYDAPLELARVVLAFLRRADFSGTRQVA